MTLTNGHQMNYADLLTTKRATQQFDSMHVAWMPDRAFPYQRRIIEWAARIGRAAIFADCGLGKTLMQMTWAHNAHLHTGKPSLVVAPLAVTAQAVADASRFGMRAEYHPRAEGATPIQVVNYDRIADVDPSRFGALVLDESSILKSFDGATRTMLIEMAQHFRFRMACTATPAPNDYIEIGNHAEFLGVCSRTEMLSEFFIHDTSGTTDAWRLKGHAESAFWDWCARWSCAIRRPSDIGGDDCSHVLPPMQVIDHVIPSPPTDGALFASPAMGLAEARKAQRASMPARAEAVARMVNASDEQWIVWVHTNDESAAVASMIPGCVEVVGSDTPESKAQAVHDFASGAVRVIVTKPSIAGFGVNWQQCRNQAWCSISYSYEQFYQAVRRCWRFGQRHPVNIHVVMSESEAGIWQAITRKSAAGDHMIDQMVNATRRIGLDMERVTSATSTAYSPESASGDTWAAHLGDCVDVWRSLPDESVGMHIFSPPFASLYTYSDSERDMGNCKDDDEFLRHFGFLVPELFRVSKPGRICAVHCMQLTQSKMRDGEIGLKDFRGDIIRLFTAHGWIYHSEVTIWKDPVTAMQRTKAHGLLHKTLCTDTCRSRQGIADYLVIFRKPGTNPENVSSGNPSWRFDRYVGQEPPITSPETDLRRYSIDVWQRYASPVWFDIDQTRVLRYSDAREDKDEKHICPLQLDVIERAIEMWSNPGDTIATPFMGIGSEAVTAVKMGRHAIGAELKRSYWQIARANLADASNPAQSTLF
jgi:hypothetical protein